MNLALFTLTIGEPNTLVAIDRIVTHTPEPFNLTVWYDTCGHGIDNDFLAELLKRTDDIIILTKNHGPSAAMSYALLYTKADYLVGFGSDSMVQPDYFNRIMVPFEQLPNVAISGEPFREVDMGDKEYELCTGEGLINFPDPLIVVNRAAVDDVGGIGGFFNFYGHDLTEWVGRAMYKGWEVALISNLIDRSFLSRSSITKNKEIDQIVEENKRVFLQARDMGYRNYKWWSSKLKEAVCH